jgi:hypothetical protein
MKESVDVTHLGCTSVLYYYIDRPSRTQSRGLNAEEKVEIRLVVAIRQAFKLQTSKVDSL